MSFADYFVAFCSEEAYNSHRHEYGALAQLGERKVRNLEARGSIPLRSTTRPVEKSTGLFF